MSAKRRKPVSPDRDFANGGEALAMERARQIVRQLVELRQGMRAAAVSSSQTKKRGRGRPKDLAIEAAVADYQFDVMEFDALRERGFGNVPPDKKAIDVAIARHFPEVMGSADLLEKKRAALKDAIKQRRRKYRA